MDKAASRIRLLLCIAKGLHFKSKCTTVAVQNDYSWKVKGLHFIENVALFAY